MGNTFEVTFTLENEDGDNFEAPTFKDFEVAGGLSQQSSFSMINGKTTRSNSYTYTLAPKSAGNFYIEPAYIKVGEKTLETLPLAIDVYPNPEGIIQKRSSKDSFFDHNFNFGRGIPETQTPVKPKSKPKRKRKIYRI